MAELTWSAEELADELGTSGSHVREHLDEIPHLRIGQRLLFPKSAIRRWLEEQPLLAIGWAEHAEPGERTSPGIGTTSQDVSLLAAADRA